MEVYAGFMAIEHNKQTMSLSPYITWAVCKKDAPPIEEDFMLLRIASEPDLWESRMASQAPIPPIYVPIINTDIANAMTYLNTYLKQQNTDALGEKVKSIKQLDIQFIVTWAATIAMCRLQIKHLMQTMRNAYNYFF